MKRQLEVWAVALMIGHVTTACVVDGVDPDRTPVLAEGEQCGPGEVIQRIDGVWRCAADASSGLTLSDDASCADGDVIVRTGDGWACATASLPDPSTTPVSIAGACMPGQVVIRTESGWGCAAPFFPPVRRTPVLGEDEVCAAGDAVVRTSVGWGCSPVVTSVDVTVDDADECGPAGGRQVRVDVGGGEGTTFEVCNGMEGADGPPGPAGELSAAVYGYRARARISLPSSGVQLPQNNNDAQSLRFISNNDLSITALAGGAPGAALDVTCGNGMGSRPNCNQRREQLGVSFTPPTDGTYRICASFNHTVSGDSFLGAVVVFLWAVTNNGNQSIRVRGPIEQAHGIIADGIARVSAVHLCDQFELSGGGRQTLRLAHWQIGSIDLNEITGPFIVEIERLAPFAP